MSLIERFHCISDLDHLVTSSTVTAVLGTEIKHTNFSSLFARYEFVVVSWIHLYLVHQCVVAVEQVSSVVPRGG